MFFIKTLQAIDKNFYCQVKFPGVLGVLAISAGNIYLTIIASVILQIPPLLRPTTQVVS